MQHLRAILCLLVTLTGVVRAQSGTADKTLELAEPLDYEVFQRQNASQGLIHVAGHAPYASEGVEVRLTGHSLSGDLPGTWESVRPDVEGDGFAGDIKAPAGGWYQLEIRLMKGGQVQAHTVIPHVGVGEVFVGAGQSNSTNYGSEKQVSTTGLVANFNGERWQLANDPQAGTQDGSHGGSFWPAFGDALAQKYQVPIGITVTGCGGTSVREWLPKGTRIRQLPTTGRHVIAVGDGEWEVSGQLFEGLAKRIVQLGPNGVRAVLWHQGESDAGQARGGAPVDRQITGEQYRTYVESLIEAARTRAGWDVPWFVAEATYHSEKDPSDPEFRDAQKQLWKSGIALEGPDTDLLGAEYRSGVHFNGRGLQAHGRAWAEKVSVYLEQVLAERP